MPHVAVASGLADPGVLEERAVAVPGLVQLYSQLSTEATHPEHAAHDFFMERYASLRAALAAEIQEAQARGELSDALDATSTATTLIAAADGLQTQWMLDPSIDMAAQLEKLWRVLQDR